MQGPLMNCGITISGLSKSRESMQDEHHNTGEDSLTLDSDRSELQRFREFIDAFCERNALPEQIRDPVTIALEELVVNAIEHGSCNPRTGAIRIDLGLRADRLQIAFSDTGMPFDPLAMPAPNLAADLGRRPIGGLGIYFVRSLISEIRYERRDNRNCLFMTKFIETTGEPVLGPGGKDAGCHGDCPR
jgi:serine/threonine-protein kinase RsbW